MIVVLMRCIVLIPIRLAGTKLAPCNNRKYMIIAVIIIIMIV